MLTISTLFEQEQQSNWKKYILPVGAGLLGAAALGYGGYKAYDAYDQNRKFEDAQNTINAQTNIMKSHVQALGLDPSYIDNVGSRMTNILNTYRKNYGRL